MNIFVTIALTKAQSLRLRLRSRDWALVRAIVTSVLKPRYIICNLMLIYMKILKIDRRLTILGPEKPTLQRFQEQK